MFIENHKGDEAYRASEVLVVKKFVGAGGKWMVAISTRTNSYILLGCFGIDNKAADAFYQKILVDASNGSK